MPIEVEILKLRRFAEEIDFKIARARNEGAAALVRLVVMKSDCWKAIGQLTLARMRTA